MTQLSEHERNHLKYQIYSFRYDDPWIPNKKVAKLVRRPTSTVDRYAKQAEEEGVLWNGSLGLRHPDRNVSLLLFEDKWRTFKALQKYPAVGYLAVCQGDWDIMALYDGTMDFSQVPGYKGKIMEGWREEVFTPKVTFTTWESCFTRMEDFVNQGESLEKSKITCNLSYPDWNEEEWKMYWYFRSNLRKKFCKLRKDYLISWRKYKEWKSTLKKYCTIMLEYYPEGYKAYDSITFCFRTDYENTLVELFSNFPTASFFYKVGEYLLANAFLPQDFEQQTRLYETLSQLLKKRILTEYTDGHNIVYYLRPAPGD